MPKTAAIQSADAYIGCRVPSDVRDRLEQRANAAHRSMSAELRHILERELNSTRKGRP
jgi:plasmid stability protein